MNSTDKIELALRSAQIAERILQLTRPVGKVHSKLVLIEVIKLVKELDAKIEALPNSD